MNLYEVEVEIVKLKEKIREEEKIHYNVMLEFEKKMKVLEKDKNMLMHNLFLDRINNAKRFINWRGLKRIGMGETLRCIDDVIEDICNKKFKILNEYFGCKNYDGYICQYETHKYFMGPKHGTMVFTIGATKEWRDGEITPTDEDLSDILYVLNLFLTDDREYLE